MEETTPDSDPIPTTADTNPNTAAPSFRLLLVAGNSAFGAFVGSIFGFGKGLIKKKGFKGSFVEARSSAKTFAVSYGVENLVLCEMNRMRGKDDVINAGVAGCCSGLALSFPGTPQDLVQSCLTYGAFSFIFEGLYRKLALPQKTSTDVKSHLQNSVNPLPNELLETL